jgi:hypothetical protein
MRPLASTCATGVGLNATVSVDLCHRSGLEYLSHGFQTQGIVVEPDQPWTSLLTWKPLLDFFYSIPCTPRSGREVRNTLRPVCCAALD